jgi:hypothetical protein
MEDNNLSLLLSLLLGIHKCMTVGVKVEVYVCSSRADLTKVELPTHHQDALGRLSLT